MFFMWIVTALQNLLHSRLVNINKIQMQIGYWVYKYSCFFKNYSKGLVEKIVALFSFLISSNKGLQFMKQLYSNWVILSKFLL